MTQTYTTILIVDDDADDAEMFRDAIHYVDENVQCYFSNDGGTAFSFLEKLPVEELPDLIILDMNMPRINGLQCLKQLKLSERFSDIPVIVYSTSKMEEDVNEMRKIGAMNFITKPSKFSDLISIAGEILEGKCVFSR